MKCECMDWEELEFIKSGLKNIVYAKKDFLDYEAGWLKHIQREETLTGEDLKERQNGRWN